MPNYLEMIRLHEASFSLRQISNLVGSSRNTVTRAVKLAQSRKLTYQELSTWEAQDIDAFFEKKKEVGSKRHPEYAMPDYEHLAKELARPGVTMQLLWEEYADACVKNHMIYYQITQFKKYFNAYLEKHAFSHVLTHRAGEVVQVDWAGTKIHWIDPDTGESLKGSLFVSVLPFSGYAYAEGCVDEKLPQWINAHIHMFAYFNGVPTLLVPDNLKASVTKHSRSELILNKTYEDMSNHYHTVVVPTRVRKPRDKGAVENTVKQLTTHLIARMRNYQCFSIQEYNKFLLLELDRFNKKPFQKKNGSRFTAFVEAEQATLQSLPERPYELCEFKDAKVYANSHIALRKHYYSVPHQYIGETVKLKIYSERVEICHNQKHLYTHSTTDKYPGAYTTVPHHLPEGSQFDEWNKERYLQWAKRIGPNVWTVIERLFEQGPEQQFYRRAHAILKMADTYSDQRLDEVCHYLLEQATNPNYFQIKRLLERQSFQVDSNTSKEPEQSYLRGAEYYDRFSNND